MGDSIGVSVSLGGGISSGGKKSQESNIGDSGNTGDGGKTGSGSIGACGGIGGSLAAALYACIYGSSQEAVKVEGNSTPQHRKSDRIIIVARRTFLDGKK
ncbi:hypothetical protein Tco_0398335 [Tanacetum coccineum]